MKLEGDFKLPVKQKANCIKLLSACPAQLRVVLKSNQISFDVVVVFNGSPQFWEFHEQQHQTLSVNRPQNVYDIQNQSVIVPRYLQRLIRDYWRLQNFSPYGIVWYNWFQQNSDIFQPKLSKPFEEFCLPNKFCFYELI